jgi:hypothetical protein
MVKSHTKKNKSSKLTKKLSKTDSSLLLYKAYSTNFSHNIINDLLKKETQIG